MKKRSTWHSLCILVYTYGSLIKLHVEICAIAFNLKVNPTFYNKFQKCRSEQQNHGRYWLLKPLRVWRLMIKELNRRSHPSSGSSLGHTVKTVATTARMPISFLMPFDGTSAVIPTLLVQTNACKMHPDAGEKGSVSYAKKIYAKKIYAEKLYAKKTKRLVVGCGFCTFGDPLTL